MGLFDRLFVIEYRYTAVQIRDFVNSLAIDDFETSAIAAMGVGPHHYIAERNLMLAGISMHALSHFASQTKKEEVRLASLALDRIMGEHYEGLPGLGAEEGFKVFKRACNYRIEEAEATAGKFLFALTDGNLGTADVADTPPLLELTQYLQRKAFLFVQANITKLK